MIKLVGRTSNGNSRRKEKENLKEVIKEIRQENVQEYYCRSLQFIRIHILPNKMNVKNFTPKLIILSI